MGNDKPIVNNLSAARYVELLQIEKSYKALVEANTEYLKEFIKKIDNIENLTVTFSVKDAIDCVNYGLELDLVYNVADNQKGLIILDRSWNKQDPTRPS